MPTRHGTDIAISKIHAKADWHASCLPSKLHANVHYVACVAMHYVACAREA